MILLLYTVDHGKKKKKQNNCCSRIFLPSRIGTMFKLLSSNAQIDTEFKYSEINFLFAFLQRHSF